MQQWHLLLQTWVFSTSETGFTQHRNLAHHRESLISQLTGKNAQKRLLLSEVRILMLADKDVPLELDWSFERLIDLNFQNCQLLKHNFTDGLLFILLFFLKEEAFRSLLEKKERESCLQWQMVSTCMWQVKRWLFFLGLSAEVCGSLSHQFRSKFSEV